MEVWCDNYYTFSSIMNPKILLSFSLNILQDETGIVKKPDVFCLYIFALKWYDLKIDEWAYLLPDLGGAVGALCWQ